ncbi:MAG TPA: hypothetical protein VFG50_11405 [Rhodothermales bacterium]|nr:hypothetical protein [Rhodothermales bacterium]
MTPPPDKSTADGRERLIGAIASAAERWKDPDYEPRAAAVERTLDLDNTFTEQSVAFAINQQVHQLSPATLQAWLQGRIAAVPHTIGVLNPGNVPFVELQDFLAVVLTGHRYFGALSSRSPFLLPAFASDVRLHAPDLDVRFGTSGEMFAAAEAVIATGSDEARAWAEDECDRHGIPPERRLLRGNRFAVAVLDGSETSDDLERLAEDALLHDGYGCRNVAVVWAPRGLAPDPLLDAFAAFRAVFPAYEGLEGALKMQQAFLDALHVPNAHGEGMEFLVSKGEPEPQRPGHVRWTEYDDMNEVVAWLSSHRADVQVVISHHSLTAALGAELPHAPFGEAQRPQVNWRPDGVDTIDFLVHLR